MYDRVKREWESGMVTGRASKGEREGVDEVVNEGKRRQERGMKRKRG